MNVSFGNSSSNIIKDDFDLDLSMLEIVNRNSQKRREEARAAEEARMREAQILQRGHYAETTSRNHKKHTPVRAEGSRVMSSQQVRRNDTFTQGAHQGQSAQRVSPEQEFYRERFERSTSQRPAASHSTQRPRQEMHQGDTYDRPCQRTRKKTKTSPAARIALWLTIVASAVGGVNFLANGSSGKSNDTDAIFPPAIIEEAGSTDDALNMLPEGYVFSDIEDDFESEAPYVDEAAQEVQIAQVDKREVLSRIQADEDMMMLYRGIGEVLARMQKQTADPVGLLNQICSSDYGCNYDTVLFLTKILCESSGRHYDSNSQVLVSDADAYGIGQVRKPTADDVNKMYFKDRPRDVKNFTDNLELAAGYMNYLIGMFDGDFSRALRAYNAGPNNDNPNTGKGYADEIMNNYHMLLSDSVALELLLNGEIVPDNRLGGIKLSGN